MLYDIWREVVRAQPHAMALREMATGRAWTFAQLAAASETSITSSPVFPTGSTAGFIMDVLRAWSGGSTVCPLEAQQASPVLGDLPSGVSHVKTTSATTGAARVVLFTAGQMAADAAQIISTMGFQPGSVNIGAISVAHSYGFSNLVLPLILHGVPLILAASALPEAMRTALEAAGDRAVVAGVPALWSAWHEAGIIEQRIALAISAGAPLPLALERNIYERTGLKVHNFYGATECGGIAYDRSASPRDDAAFVGTAMDRVALVTGDDGCLEVRSEAAGLRYWPEEDIRLGEGRFKTGDLAECVEGRILLRGRVGDLMNIAGRKVSPDVIERSLLQHPGVNDCLVFGVPAEGAGRAETIVACVVVRGAVTSRALRDFLLEHLEGWQVPREWCFCAELPVNLRGKRARHEWQRRYLAGELTLS